MSASAPPRFAAALVLGALAGLLAACAGDGGGGGGGPVHFTRGFAFIRDDDGDVYVADQSDYTSVGRLTTNGGNRQPSLSPDGRQVAFIHVDAAGVSSLMAVATDGAGSPRTVYVASAGAGQKNLKDPAFSPDGATLVFAFEVYTTSYLGKVTALDGSGFVALTAGPLSYASPTFYPDAVARDEVLAAAGSGIGQYTQLDRLNVVTGQVLPVSSDLGPEAASIAARAVLSRDGLQVAFEGRLATMTAATRIFVQTLSSGATVRVSDAGAGSADALHTFPSWVSASQVAFVSDEGGARQVYVQGTAAPGTGTLTLPSADQAWFGP